MGYDAAILPRQGLDLMGADERPLQFQTVTELKEVEESKRTCPIARV